MGRRLEGGGQGIDGFEYDDVGLIAGEHVKMLSVDPGQAADFGGDAGRDKFVQPAGAITQTQAVVKNPLQHAVEGAAVPADALPGARVGVMSSAQRDHGIHPTPRGRTTAGGGGQFGQRLNARFRSMRYYSLVLSRIGIAGARSSRPECGSHQE